MSEKWERTCEWWETSLSSWLVICCSKLKHVSWIYTIAFDIDFCFPVKPSLKSSNQASDKRNNTQNEWLLWVVDSKFLKWTVHCNDFHIMYWYKINQVYVPCQYSAIINDRFSWCQTIQEIICYRLCQKSADIQWVLDYGSDMKFQFCVIYAWVLLSGCFGFLQLLKGQR